MNELVERRQAPAFDVGIVLDQTYRTFAAGPAGSKTGEMRVPVWSMRELLVRGQLDSTGAASCLLYTSPSPRDKRQSRMPSSA